MATAGHGVSAESRRTVVERLDQVLESGADAGRVGADLFSVTALLDREPSLRRTLTDPSMDSAAKGALVHDLLGDKVDGAAAEVAAAAAGLRWSASRDLGDTLEHAGVVAQVVAAEGSGQADELEDEMFRFNRIVAGEPRLREALADRSVPVAHRAELVRSLLGDKATEATVRLVEQALSGRHRSLAVALQEYQEVAAERRERLVATVRVARPLSEEARRRLTEALGREYDHPVHLNVVVDEEVLGGLRVEIGDEVIDGTVASRLDEARRRLAG
ncbi:MAG TPA: F0F1 ATP synthase subunit delta [Nocardioidaceae bacterium]|nr:F0F1 ATP synthase subunit delta [Nocardioidaceae bacterium]